MIRPRDGLTYRLDLRDRLQAVEQDIGRALTAAEMAGVPHLLESDRRRMRRAARLTKLEQATWSRVAPARSNAGLRVH